ncbi:MAG: HlyD family efflux transporter periplasmic adaptor subunit [Pseudomonadota bacterium]
MNAAARLRWAGLVAAAVLGGCDGDAADSRAVGQLESERVEVVVEASERIVERGVAEGTRVAAGDMLYRLDPTLADARLRAAAATHEERIAALEELTNGTRVEVLDQARAELAGAEDARAFRDSELERLTELAKKGLASETAVDTAAAALDDARAILNTRRARLEELANGARPEAVRRAQAAVAAAAAERDRLAEELERHTVRAPVDALLDRYLFEVGERPQAGQAGAILLTGTQPYASVFLPAAMRARLAVGAAVDVAVEGMDAPLRGSVRWVSAETAYTPYFALTEHDRGRLSYRAEIDLGQAGSTRLPEGLPVEVHLPAGD